MSGPPDKSANRFARLAALPPYVLAAVDEVKSRLRAEGHDVFDFGLGNPDGPSPRAAVERLTAEAQRAGNQRYMPSRGLTEVRAAICDWYLRHYGQTFDPETEAVVTLGSKEGLAHLLLAIVGPGDCVLSPDPCYPIHRYGVIIAGGEPVPVATGPGLDPYAEIEAALRRSPRKPKGLIVNFPHNPTSAIVDLSFFEKVVALARRESLWVISDLAYADLVHDGRPAPSIFQVPGARELAVEFFTISKSYSMPGWRVGFGVGNRTLVGALGTIKGYLDYGIFAPVQLAAATALSSACDADVAANRELYKHRRRRCSAASFARRAGTSRSRWPRCSSGRRCRRRPWPAARSASPPSCWSTRGWRSRRESGSARAARATSGSPWSRTTSGPEKPAPPSGPFWPPARIDIVLGLK